MTNQYRTLGQVGVDEFTVNKSRFIGYASPAGSEQEALDFIRQIREKHRDASHNCYAYIIGENQGIMRYSDDGEPSGTAGMPMLDVIRNMGLVYCVVVATRYFGGVLLGTGGLVRAYTQSCKIALTAAQPVVMKRTNVYPCLLPYACWDRLNHYIESSPVRLTDIDYADQIRFRLEVTAEEATHVLDEILNVTGRKIVLGDPETSFMPWKLSSFVPDQPDEHGRSDQR